MVVTTMAFFFVDKDNSGAGGRNNRSIADLLESLPEALPDEHFRLRELLAVLGYRSMASVLLLLAIPQVLPTPLFLSNVLAVPIVILAIQMAMGRQIPWLPAWLMDKPLWRRRLEQICFRVVPVLRYVERFIRPRMSGIWSNGNTMIGLACCAIALVSVAPLPFTGWIPGWALLLIALGLLQRDGLLVVVGLVIGTMAIAIFVAVIVGLISVGEAVASNSGDWLQWLEKMA